MFLQKFSILIKVDLVFELLSFISCTVNMSYNSMFSLTDNVNIHGFFHQTNCDSDKKNDHLIVLGGFDNVTTYNDFMLHT